MRKPWGNKIKLGIFVTIAFTLFLAGIYLIGQRQQLFSRTFHISGIFKDINGLQVGNNVRFSGINVGIIENIQQLTDSTVIVEMLIVESTRKFIKKNAKAIIATDGIIGSKILLIIPGAAGAKEIEDQDQVETTTPVTMEDIMVNLKITSDNAAIITTDLAVIMENVLEGNGIIGKLLWDSTLAQNAEDALVNIKLGAGGFKQNMDAASHNFLLKGFLKKQENAKEKAAEEAAKEAKPKEKTREKANKK